MNGSPFLWILLIGVGSIFAASSLFALGGREGMLSQSSSCREVAIQCREQQKEDIGLCYQNHNPSYCGKDHECAESEQEDQILCVNEAYDEYAECLSECDE